MENFIELKNELLAKAIEADAKANCIDFLRAKNAGNEKELLEAIRLALAWCTSMNVISDEYFSKFDPELFLNSGIANTGGNNKGYGNAGNDNAGNDNAGNDNAGYYNAGNDNAGYYNAGNRNAGNRNAGNRNAGNDNAGNDNAGNDNAGNDNAGYYNAGNDNAGYYNAGNDNAGNRNAGYSNAGNDNAGYYNAGYYNAGNRNAGYSNAGNDNAGAFNSVTEFKMFNKTCSKTTFEIFRNSKAFNLLHSIVTTLWISSGQMSIEEKENYHYHVTTGGYYRVIPYKEAFVNTWNNWNDAKKNAFFELENFDSEVFFEITGVRV